MISVRFKKLVLKKIMCRKCEVIGEISNMFKIEELLNKWDKNKPVSLRKIQEHAQCIRCINRNSERCKSKDKFLIRVCYDFIPRSSKTENPF